MGLWSFAVFWAALAPADENVAPADPRCAPEPLVVAGFAADPTLAERDTWIPLSVEETLAWRLRRVEQLVVVPTIRAHQARRELADSDELPNWSRVVPLLGARWWLSGSSAGTQDELRLTLRLSRIGDASEAASEMQLGPGRLFDVLDEATRWSLGALGVTRLKTETERLIFAPPSASRSALEYYAKALAAARCDEFGEAAYRVQQSVASDPAFRPALLLLAKLELRASPPRYAAAASSLNWRRCSAAAARDDVDETDFELTQGLLMLLSGSPEVAEQRFEAALARAYARDDPYGQLAAMNHLCDLWLNRRPPGHAELAPAALARFEENNLRRAAEWQHLVLDLLARLNDVVAEAPAANKLALIYERLNEPQRAFELHQRTLAAARRTGSRRNLATGWMFLGQWYRSQQRWQEALEATSRCLALVPEAAKPRVRIALAEIYRAMALPREALAQYESAHAALASGDDLLNQLQCLRGIAELRWELGDRRIALDRLSQALQLAEALELPETPALRRQLERWQQTPP